MNSALPIVVLASGSGTNLQAIVDRANQWVDIKCVISDQCHAHALVRATKADIPAAAMEQREDQTREEYCNDLARVVDIIQGWTSQVVIVLAGFMKILSPCFVNTFPNQILNIHPSLLPKYKGIDTHRRVLEAGDTEHGVTIHWVDNGLDSGLIVDQKSFPVTTADTEETLKQKAHGLEHVMYPNVLKQLAVGGLKLGGSLI